MTVVVATTMSAITPATGASDIDRLAAAVYRVCAPASSGGPRNAERQLSGADDDRDGVDD
jgi:hypothetical protein